MNNAVFGARLLIKNLNLKVEESTVEKCLLDIFGEGSFGIDMVSLMARMADDRELSVILNSWLNYDKNKVMLPKELLKIVNQKEIEAFAKKINVDSASAAYGLSVVLPEIISGQLGMDIYSSEMDKSHMA